MTSRRHSDPWDEVACSALDLFVSPITDADHNPLLDAIASVEGRDRLVVADLGCGAGPLLPHLVPHFAQVIALDRSREMLDAARARMTSDGGTTPPNLELQQRSLTELRGFDQRFDVTVTANSILMVEPRLIRRCLRAVARSLADGGVYFGVFPALESIADTFRFAYERELAIGLDPDLAQRAAHRTLRGKRIDFALGIFDNGRMKQKHYSRHELGAHICGAGFEIARWDRIIYRPDIRYRHVERYSGRPPRVWHWFVECRLPHR